MCIPLPLSIPQRLPTSIMPMSSVACYYDRRIPAAPVDLPHLIKAYLPRGLSYYVLNLSNWSFVLQRHIHLSVLCIRRHMLLFVCNNRHVPAALAVLLRK